jgi:hypothetical protein
MVPYSDDVLRQLGKTVSAAEIDKDIIGWNLREIENLAHEAVRSNAAGERLPDSDDESDESDSDSSESTTSTSDSDAD